MAFISGGFYAVFNLMDSGGDTTSKTYELDVADAAGATTAIGVIKTALEGVTNCEIVSYYHYEKWVENTVAYPVGGVQKENQALLVFDIVDAPTKRATHAIPGAKIDIFIAASGPDMNVVDRLDAAVIAYRELFQAGGECFISDGEKAFTLLSGHRRNTKNNRG